MQWPTPADAPKTGFRLSMLIYDTRYRSITIQVIVLILFGLFVSWLVNNTIQNLARQGPEFNFGFLWNRAGYDINQTLIPYTNDSTHFRALLVGLVNTLVRGLLRLHPGHHPRGDRRACCGCRRTGSSARLMTVYVEMFRNVPLLLWILLSYVDPVRDDARARRISA